MLDNAMLKKKQKEELQMVFILLVSTANTVTFAVKSRENRILELKESMRRIGMILREVA